MSDRTIGTVTKVARTGDFAYLRIPSGRMYFARKEQMREPRTITPHQLVEFTPAPCSDSKKFDYALDVVAIGLIAAEKKEAA